MPAAAGVSKEGLDMVHGLLIKDAANRYTGEQCKCHDWFAAHNPPLHSEEDWQKVYDKELKPPWTPPPADEEGGNESKKEKPSNSGGGCFVM